VLAETRAFFGPRAGGWEERFPDDGPLYEAAVTEMGLVRGATVLDAGCGTGRALPALRGAVGADGAVVGADVTVEMLAEAVRLGRRSSAVLALADVNRLPIRDASLDGVFAAGLLPHLRDPVAGLSELARVSRRGARLALFHPIGREALARRHGHAPDPDSVLSEVRVRAVLATSGWRPELLDDGEHRYLVLAVRS
jgi:SAM-dependent methyltransferase